MLQGCWEKIPVRPGRLVWVSGVSSTLPFSAFPASLAVDSQGRRREPKWPCLPQCTSLQHPLPGVPTPTALPGLGTLTPQTKFQKMPGIRGFPIFNP